MGPRRFWGDAYDVPLNTNSPAEVHAQALLKGGLGKPRRQLLCLLKLHRPALWAQLPERVHVEGELITGGHEVASAGQQLVQVVLVSVQARVVPAGHFLVQSPAGMVVAELLHLLGQGAPHGPWPWALGQRPEGVDQVGGGDLLAGQGLNALGTGALQGIVEVGHRLAQLPALGGGGGQCALVPGLLGSDLAQVFPGSLHGIVGTVEPGPGPVVASHGIVSGVSVDATPPALAGQLQCLLGLPHLAEDIAAVPLDSAHLGLGPPPLVADVERQAGPEAVEVGGIRGSGLT